MNPSRNSLYRFLALSSLTAVASWSSAQQVIDGFADYQYNAPIVCQNVATNFGDNLSELDVAYSYISGGVLYVTLAGNLENNGNKLNIFIDSTSGGQNQLRGDNWKDTVNNSWYLTRLGNSGGTNGLKFETGFAADYFFGVNRSGGQLYLDYSATPDTANNIGFYLGQSDLSLGFLSGGTSLNIKANYNGSNTVGTDSGTSTGYAKGGTVSTGLELAIPLAAIGNPTGTVRICAFVANGDNSFLSNQFLPGVGYNGGLVDNYGEPRVPIDLGGGGSNTGTQYFIAPWANNGRLAVLRLGSGTGALANSATNVFIDEYDTAGVLKQTATFPATASVAGLTNSGTATSEGALSVSADGLYLVTGGYNATSGTAAIAGTTAAANPRLVGTMNRSKVPDITTVVTGGFSGSNIRGANMFDARTWSAGSSDGIRTNSYQSATTSVVSSTITNNRVVGTFNNQLYFTTSSGTTRGLYAVGAGMPSAASTTSTIFLNTGSSSSPYTFWFADALTCYVADDRTPSAGGVQKYVYSGGAWSLVYTLNTSLPAGYLVRGVCGTKDTLGRNVLYMVAATSTNASKIFTLTDTGISSPFTSIADSPANTVFRGIQLSIFPLNTAPVATNQSPTAVEDTPLAITLGATDGDGDSLTYSYTQPANGVVSGTGPNVTYTPNANYFGSDSFTFKANDGTVDSNTATVSITVSPVNDAPTAANGIVSGDEDTNITGNASAVDIEGDTLTYSKVSDPANGSVVVNGDGSYTYTPNANFNGSDSFTFKVNDGSVDSNIATITITVNPTNDAPTADDSSASGDEDTNITGNATGSDPDGDPLTYSKVSDPANGSVVVNGDGSFTYTPNANFNGSDSFTFKVNDGQVDSNIATISITVNPTNDAPTADDSSASGDEDTNITGNATGSDPDGDPLTFSKVSEPANGTVVVNGDGSYTYTPNANFNGSDSFTFKVNDGSVDSNIATISITVNPTNDAPTADDSSASGDEDTNITGNATGSDPDGDPLTYSKVSDPANGSVVVNGDGSFTYTPNANFNGSDSFTFKVNDGQVDSNIATISISVNPTNDAPTADDSSASGDEDTNITGSATGSDPDGDPLTYSKVSDPANGSVVVNGDGSFTYTPNSNYYGSDSFTFKVNDGTVDSNIATISITVNPVDDQSTAQDDAYTTAEDTQLLEAAPGVLGNDTYNDTPGLVAELVSTTSHGTLVLNADGSFDYTPNLNYNGIDTFTYKAFDGASYSNTATVTITVTPVLDVVVEQFASPAPNFYGAPSYYGWESNSMTALENGLSSVGDRNTDPTAYIQLGPVAPWYEAVVSGFPSWLGMANPMVPFNTELGNRLHFGVRILGNGTRIKLANLYNDMNSNDFDNVFDNDGDFVGYPYQPWRKGIDYGPDRVKGTLDDIVYNNGESESLEVDEIVYVGVGNAFDATFEPGFTDQDRLDSVRCYVGDNEPYIVSNTYVMRDDSLTPLASSTVTVTLDDGNTAPVANSDTVEVAEDTPTAITLTGTDAENDPLTFNVLTQPAHGTLSGTAPNLTYTPDANYSGPDSFTFKVSDGVCDSNTATISINVNTGNDIPVANNGVASGDEDTAISGNATGSDGDGDSLTFIKTSDPNNGSVVLNNDGSFTYTPNANFNGTDSFMFKVNDGTVDSNVATISITVNPTNDAPTADDGSASGDEDTNISGNASASDIDGDALTYSKVSDPASGSVVMNNDGSFTYTPNANFNGSDSFTFKVNDGTVDSNVATITITVAAVNDAPVANDDTVGVAEDGGFTINPRGNDTDVENDPLTLVSITQPAHGTAVLNGFGGIDYSPDPNYNGPDSFTYVITDGTSNSNPATIHITVEPINDAPTADDGSASGDEDTNISGNAAASDIDGDPLTFSKVSDPANGSVVMNNDGSFTYTPNANFNGSDSFTFKVNDGSVDSNIATITITVDAVNDAPVLTVPGGQMIAQCVDLAITGVSVSDVDVESGQVEADLQVANGTLTLTTLGGLTFSTGDGTGDAHMVFTGTLADVNAALATLHYMSNSGFSGTDTLTATVSDLGNTGSGGPKTDTETISIEVTPVGASTVHPAGYTVIEGYELTGGLNSLLTSDDDTLSLLNDENTLGVTVEFFATAPCMNPSELTFAMEVSVGRFGLSQEFLLYNYSTSQWDAFAQGTAPTVDTVASLTLNGSAANYVNQTTGEMKARMHWQPINDEDPAQDGWPHYVDEAKWVVAP